MQTTTSPSLPRRAGRAGWVLERRPMVFRARVMLRALGWVLLWLRQRERLSAETVAQRAEVGPQTLRDLEKGRCRNCGWTTLHDLCRALKLRLTHVERLTYRYLLRDFRHQERHHQGQEKWQMVFPWSKKRAKPRIRCRADHGKP
ncbi:MAG: helix-turn-helix transcriptional regulator [Verrucomicrobiota bacterium]|nr:helix-turn-helix transcriptional regulator [Verrucomicrobiota bacterium]